MKSIKFSGLDVFEYQKIKMDHPIPTRPSVNQQEKNMDFAVPANLRVEMQENKEIDKYLELSRELKRQ